MTADMQFPIMMFLGWTSIYELPIFLSSVNVEQGPTCTSGEVYAA